MSKVCPKCGHSYSDASIFCPSDGSTLRPADSSGDIVGTVIADRYLIMEKLGEGGMGRVYRAQHVRLPQEVAIKVLSPALVYDTEALARFNREASNACRINAEHVARVYDFGETSTGLVYLAMEYVPGVTLSALLKAEAPLTPTRVANLTAQVAEGLEAAHKLGIVHRDLKPDNILVMSEPDGTELAKVVDFGIAKAIDGDGQNVTRAGIVLGTAQFMSPEQVIGQLTDRRTDVYALGLVAFMMLTGALPFEADTAEEVMFKRLSEPPKTLAEERPDIAWPARLQKVFDRALARELNDRFATANELARELTATIEEWVRQPAAAARVPASSTRRPELIAAATAGVLVIAVIAALLLRRQPEVAPRIAAADSTQAVTQSGALSGTTNPEPRAAVPPSPAGTSATPLPESPTTPRVPAAQRTTSSSSASPASTPADGPARSASTGEAPRASVSRVSDAERARTQLERVVETLHPDVITSTAAREAILALRSLLPQLTTAEDTVKAELNRAGAYVYLEQMDQACAILGGLTNTASPRAQRQIDDQREALGCR